MIFERRFQVGWTGVDMNGHLRNTAYLDRCVDVRIGFFHEPGFPAAECARRQIGPVIRRDDIEYHREMRLRDELRVMFSMAGMRPKGSRFIFRNDRFRADGTLPARVTTVGGWLDVQERRLTIPPAPIGDALAENVHHVQIQQLRPRRRQIQSLHRNQKKAG